jgi:hypothetical protein
MISTISDTPLPPPYSIPSPVISVVAMAIIEALAHFDLRFPPPIYEPFFFDSPLYNSLPIPSAFTYNFSGFGTLLPSSLFDSKPSGFCGCYGAYRGSGILYFTVPFSPISDFRTSPYFLQDQ